ncbi:MAG: FHA domain-containing protein [Anaerolineae bacterium]
MGPVTSLQISWPVDWGLLQLALLGLIGLVGILLLVAVVAALVPRKREAEAARQRVASPAVPGRAWLWVRSGPGAGAQHPVTHTTTLMGSAPEAHASIPHPQVSPHHASLSRQEGGFVLQDLGSAAGTFVNGHRITAAVWVRPGDVINLGGGVELVLQA